MISKINVIQTIKREFYVVKITEYKGMYTATLTTNSGETYTGKSTLADGAYGSAIRQYQDNDHRRHIGYGA